VLADGRMRGFVPNELLIGHAIKGVGNHAVKARTMVTVEPLAEWVRTRFGYVVGHGPFYEELCQRSYGDFAKPAL
jgi:hypothetical protein